MTTTLSAPLMHLPARLISILALAASCVAAPGQLPSPTQLKPAPPVPPQFRRPGAIPRPAAEAPTPSAPVPAPAKRAEPEKPKGPPPSKGMLEDLTERLMSDDFKSREYAQAKLNKLAKSHPVVTLDAVLRKYLKAPAPEARYRLRAILYSTKQAEYLKVPRGFVGIVMGTTFPQGAAGNAIPAIYVSSVLQGSAAHRFGLQRSDQIVSIDGKPFSSSDPMNEFANYVTGKTSGEIIELAILRNLQRKTIKLELGHRPPEVLAQDPRVQSRFEAHFKTWLDERSTDLRENK